MTIRPTYRNERFIGFHVEVNGHPVGRVMSQYKHAVLLRDQMAGESDEDDQAPRWQDRDADDAGQPRFGEL